MDDTTLHTDAAAPSDVAPAPAPSIASLTMGTQVLVRLADGGMLRNNESKGWFEPGTPTPQTVTVTLLRRLADGDLVLC